MQCAQVTGMNNVGFWQSLVYPRSSVTKTLDILLAPVQGIAASRNAFYLGFVSVHFSLPERALVFVAAFILLASLPQALGRGKVTSQQPEIPHLDVQFSSHCFALASVKWLAGVLITPSLFSFLPHIYFSTSNTAEPLPFWINLHFHNLLYIPELVSKCLLLSEG